MTEPTLIWRLQSADIAPHVLVCGDPGRAEEIAGQLENARLVAQTRGYVTYTGAYRGLRVTACSHGIGGPSAAICFEELIQAGARTLIRVGTCGSYLSHLRSGGLAIGTAAIREDGATPFLVPLSFPAVADMDVTQALIGNAGRLHPAIPVQAGIIRSRALFYDGLLPREDALWIQAGAIAVEMEFSALLVVAALRRVRAGGIFAVDGNPAEQAEMSARTYAPHQESVQQATQAMVAIALESLFELSQQGQYSKS